ncbi:MAG: hypothetical protein HC859_12310 [Bacteroidia bacterium]|nr:hypothetical protein [Bacteroidia bacterium]
MTGDDDGKMKFNWVVKMLLHLNVSEEKKIQNVMSYERGGPYRVRLVKRQLIMLRLLSVFFSCSSGNLFIMHGAWRREKENWNIFSGRLGALQNWKSDLFWRPGKNYWTEFNTSIRSIESSQSAATMLSIDRINGNPVLKCSFNAAGSNQYSGIKMAVYKTEFDTEPLPSEIAGTITGFSFNAMAYKVSMVLRVDAIDVAGNVIKPPK